MLTTAGFEVTASVKRTQVSSIHVLLFYYIAEFSLNHFRLDTFFFIERK